MSRAHLEKDPDILEEANDFNNLSVEEKTYSSSVSSDKNDIGEHAKGQKPFQFIPLRLDGNSFRGDKKTQQLLAEIGGVETLKSMTDLFYKKAFADPHLDQFIRSHDDPHFERLANWIAEKMDPSNKVWTKERHTRPLIDQELCRGQSIIVHDRSSAHAAAWHCVKRDPAVQGEHFKLHDSRVWMRLMFWSGRETGVFERSPTFASWFVRFIAHFVRVYEREAPRFARESFRWSESKDNVSMYLDNGNRMGIDVLGKRDHGVSFSEALKQLPKAEREDPNFPYGSSDL